MTTRRILVGLDGSAGACAALEWCRDYACALDAEVVAVCVIDLLPFVAYPPIDAGAGRTLDEFHTEMARALEDWVAPLRAAGIPCRTSVIPGTPAAALDDAAVEHDCDLIVVGRRGHGGFAELLLGSVPHALAHHSHRSLVIVPAQEQPR